MKTSMNKPPAMRWNSRLRILAGLAVLAGCASTEVDAPAVAPLNQVDVGRTYSALVGQDGDYTVTAANQIVNAYSSLGVAAATGDKTITVKNATDLNNPMNGMPLKKGDLLLLYQAQGATIDTTDAKTYGAVTALNGAGSFEFVTVESVSGNMIQLGASCNGLRNAYPNPGLVQVVRVPQFNNLTIQAGAAVIAKAWDGTSGGVVAIHALGKTNLSGLIDVTAQGFRGGRTDAVSNAAGSPKVVTMRTTDPTLGAEKGEGIAGTPDDYQNSGNGKYGRGAPANGGGGGNAHNAGGGGGGGGGDPTLWTGQGVMDSTITGGMIAWTLDQAYKDGGNKYTTSTGGGRGGYSYSRPAAGMTPDPTIDGPTATKWGGDNRQDVGGLGGRPLEPTVGFQLFMGGGGGAGDQDNNSGGNGGNGGGVVFLISDTITVPGPMTGAIKASGGDGGYTANGHNDGAGGAGGGGSIFIVSNQPLSTNVQLIADGGFGGAQYRAPSDAAEADGPGGGGGGGFIAHTTSGTPTVSAKGVAAGTTVAMTLAKFPANGATNGNVGKSVVAPRQPMVAGMPGYYPICLPADLNVKVTPPTGQVAPGQNIDYTVVITNTGENPATQSDVTTTFPANVNPTQVTWLCTAAGGAVCPMAGGTAALPTRIDLPVGGSLTYTVKMSVPATNPMSTLNLTIGAQPPPGYTDPTPANNITTGMAPIVGGTVVTPKSDLEVIVTKTPTVPAAGEETTVTITAKNNGPDKADKPVAVFSIPPGSTVTQPPPPASDPNAAWTCVGDGVTYTCTLRTDLPPNMSAMPLVVKFKTPLAPTSTPQVAVSIGTPGSTDPNPTNNTSIVDVGPSKPRTTADLALTVSKSPATAGPGTETTYTFQVTNKGPDSTQSPAVTFTVPVGSMVTQPAMGSGWVCTQSSTTFLCLSGALLQKGAAPPITVKIIAPAVTGTTPPGSVAGVVSSAASNDPNPSNNSDSKPVAGTVPTTGSDLTVRITTDNATPKPGDTVTFTATASNRGPDTVQNPTVVINLPPGAKITQPAQGDGWTCAQANTAVLCSRGTIDRGDAPPITVKVQYPSSTDTTGAPPSAVVGAPNNNDPVPGNNTAVIDTRPTTPRSNADLALTIAKSPTGGAAGSDLTYTLQVTNKGPAASITPSVTFSVPSNSSIVQPPSGTGWSCIQTGTAFTCYLGSTLQAGAASPLTLKVNTPGSPDPGQAAGVVYGVVSSPSTDDPDLSNNAASVSVNNPPATGSDLIIRISSSPSAPKAGTEVTYTVEASNGGPDTVRNPFVAVQLPPGAVITDGPRGDGWSCLVDASTVVCTRDSVAPGTAPIIQIRIKLPTDPATVPAAHAAVGAPSNNDPKLPNNVASSELNRFTGGGFACAATGHTPASGSTAVLGLLLSAMALLFRRRHAS